MWYFILYTAHEVRSREEERLSQKYDHDDLELR